MVRVIIIAYLVHQLSYTKAIEEWVMFWKHVRNCLFGTIETAEIYTLHTMLAGCLLWDGYRRSSQTI